MNSSSPMVSSEFIFQESLNRLGSSNHNW